ncbi:MAG: aldehyde dehydrogenase family protein, partial [Desulfobulbaceae bacterium]|nr:aldehyde dehydrogenase family protein [Desulfobulbaceae bacterium]
IDGRERAAIKGETFIQSSPTNGKTLGTVARPQAADVRAAVNAARRAQPAWASLTPVQRGELLYKVAMAMQDRREDIAYIVALETGKSLKDAFGETDGAVALGMFMAGEGRRLYSRTLTSGVPNKYCFTIRQPLGVAGLIIAANTPIANVAWKAFPALICGNVAVMKAAEDTPATAWIFAKIAHEAGLPAGVFNLIQGYGEEAGAPLVENPDVDIISFTGSTEVGRYIAKVAGERLAKVSLELGGKNPLVVCDDADLENAAKWVLLSAFSNAGQRCASASRIIIFDAVYDKFRDMLVEKTGQLKIGTGDEDDLGPVINEAQLNNMLTVVEQARKEGATILIGGYRMTDPEHAEGYYMAPTIIESVAPKADISIKELFGPITCLCCVKGFKEALELANNCPYGLTACIHTRNLNRAMEFSQKVQAGVAVVNAGTYGSEPHMPFGGIKQSGNGFREPGTEALDVYSEIKNICIVSDPGDL